MWVRGFRGEQTGICWNGRWISFHSDLGSFEMTWEDLSQSRTVPQSSTVHKHVERGKTWDRWHARLRDEPQFKVVDFQFRLWRGQHIYPLGLTVPIKAVVAPAWFVTLLFTIPPMAWYVVRRWRRHKLSLVGYCRSCGYDLRGTDDGPCPECGNAREAKARPWQRPGFTRASRVAAGGLFGASVLAVVTVIGLYLTAELNPDPWAGTGYTPFAGATADSAIGWSLSRFKSLWNDERGWTWRRSSSGLSWLAANPEVPGVEIQAVGNAEFIRAASVSVVFRDGSDDAEDRSSLASAATIVQNLTNGSFEDIRKWLNAARAGVASEEWRRVGGLKVSVTRINVTDGYFLMITIEDVP